MWGWGWPSWERPDFRVWHHSPHFPPALLCVRPVASGLPRLCRGGWPASPLVCVPFGPERLLATRHLGSRPVPGPHLCPNCCPGSWPAAGRWPACCLLGLTLPPTRPAWPRAVPSQASVSSSVIGRRAKRTPRQASDCGSPDRDSRWIGVGPAGGAGWGGASVVSEAAISCGQPLVLRGKEPACFFSVVTKLPKWQTWVLQLHSVLEAN